MANDFRSFAKSGKGNEQEGMKKLKEKYSDGEIHNAENFAKKHENMSEGQMLGEIQKMAQQSGGVNQQELSAFVSQIMPMLDSEQKAKLQVVLQSLKR